MDAKKPANKPSEKNFQGTCESCLNYAYDEETDDYYCVMDMDLDEDDMRLLILNQFRNCPFYQFDNEYKIVNKQI